MSLSKFSVLSADYKNACSSARTNEKTQLILIVSAKLNSLTIEDFCTTFTSKN